VLIEKIAEAVDGIARPWQIKRVAEAEAEADKIHAVAQIEISELQRRAVTRLFAEEAKKQNNTEAITAKALPELNSDAKPEDVEDDWIANCFDKCRLISDEEMQKLWAKVLSRAITQLRRILNNPVPHFLMQRLPNHHLGPSYCHITVLEAHRNISVSPETLSTTHHPTNT
jgi:Protein of unknown function (DUF2806)